MNAKFWTWINGWVLLTIKPNQTLTHTTRGLHEEGWQATHREWYYDGVSVVFSFVYEGTDCDGYLKEHGASICTLEELQTVPTKDYHDRLEIRRPNWQNLKDIEVYDRYAEHAGY